MGSGYAKAKTVYLDSAHWFDLTDCKLSRERFETAIKMELIVPVISFIHLLEICNREESFRSSVASYIDHIACLTSIRWIKGLPSVAKTEVENSFLKANGVTPTPVSPLVEHFVDTLETKLPWFSREEARYRTVSRIVEDLSSTHEKKRYGKFRELSPVFDIKKLRVLRSGKKSACLVADMPMYAADYLGKSVTTPNGIRISVTHGSLERFKETFSLSECPAFATKIANFEGWSRSSGGEEASMFEDLFHLVALAYCDITFVDGRTWEALKKGRNAGVPLTKMPLRNGKFASWLKDLRCKK